MLDPDTPPLSVPLYLAQHTTHISLEPTAVVVELVIFVLLLLASALFSGSEVALFSLDRSAREVLVERGDRSDLRVLTLLEHPRQLLVTILLLNTIVNVAAAILAAIMTAQVAAGLALSSVLVVILEVIALSFVLLVVSEITPKLVATQHAMTYSRRASGVLLFLHRLLHPITHVLARSMNAIQGRLKAPAPQRISTDDLKAMVAIGEAHGTLEEEERNLITSIVEFGEVTVREIMVSRLDVVALPVSATLPEALTLIRESGHSRMPLYVEHLDNILGIVYAKDLLPYLPPNNGTPRIDWTRIARPPMFVPLGKKLDDLLTDFQAKKTHMAIVVDEYGGTAGLVTMEDVLEEIVGDIRDEHDEPEERLYQQLDADRYRIDARMNLDEIDDLLGLSVDADHFDFETLGGLIFHLTGDIPAVGQEIAYGPLRMHVETVENHRIGSVLVQVVPPLEEEPVVQDNETGE